MQKATWKDYLPAKLAKPVLPYPRTKINCFDKVQALSHTAGGKGKLYKYGDLSQYKTKLHM